MAKNKKGKAPKSHAEEIVEGMPEGCVMTPVFRASWLRLPNEEKNKYEVTALFDTDENFAEMERIMKAALRSKFGKNYEIEDMRLPFNNGSKRARKSKREGKDESYFQDTTYCNFATQNEIPCADSDGTELACDDKALYAGAYYRAIINAYAYDNQQEGVSFGLVSLMKVRDGEKITGGTGGMSSKQAGSVWAKVAKDAPKGKKGKGKKK